jgi:phage baseplate assembly protein W
MSTGYKYYKGFSTRNYAKKGGTFDLFNVELIEDDLMNELFTIRGDRVKMPTFGTRIPLMVMELNDQESQDILKEDVETVINNDPRVELKALDVITNVDRNNVIIVAKVLYKEFLVTKDLRIEVNGQ